MRIVLSSLLFFFSLILFSCSGQEEGESVLEGNIYIRYDQVGKQLKADIRFYRDSQAVKLNGPVLLQGKKLIALESTIRGWSYSTDRSFQFEEALTLQFENESFKIPLPFLLSFSPDEDFSISEGGRVSWEGPELGNGEFLIIHIEDSKRNGLNLNRLGPSSSPSTAVFGTQLIDLSPGEAELYLIRKITYQDAAEKINLNVVTEFYSSPLKFNLKP